MVGNRTSYPTGIPTDLWRGVPAAPPVASVLSHRHHGTNVFFSFDLYFFSNVLHLKMQPTSFSFSSFQVQWRALGPYGRPVPLCSVC